MVDADHPEPGAGDSVEMTILVAPGHDFATVAETLREAGVEVHRALSRSRIVGGKVPLTLVDSLGAIPGVKMARAAETFQLPPFSDKVPQ